MKPMIKHMKYECDANEMIHVNAIGYFPKVIQYAALQSVYAVRIGSHIEYDNKKGNAEKKIQS